MITVDIKGKAFGATPVLGPVSFSISEGETVAILGPSGIGKSTLLRIVAGLDEDYDGTVTRPDRIGMVFQEPTLLPWRSAIDNLLLPHPALARSEAEAMLARVGLSEKAAVYPGQMSLGQQRRLSLARAFGGKPALLIMDEPFASLDPDTGRAMLDLTARLISETRPAVLFVTHVTAEANRLADRVLELQGTPATLRERKELS